MINAQLERLVAETKTLLPGDTIDVGWGWADGSDYRYTDKIEITFDDAECEDGDELKPYVVLATNGWCVAPIARFADPKDAVEAAIAECDAEGCRIVAHVADDLEVSSARYATPDFQCGGCGSLWRKQYAIGWNTKTVFVGWLDLVPCCDEFRVQNMTVSSKSYGFDEIDAIEYLLGEDDRERIVEFLDQSA